MRAAVHEVARQLAQNATLLEGPPPSSPHRSLISAFADLRRELAVRRLDLFRMHVGRSVTTVSPLLLRACALDGRDLDALVHDLLPDATWRPWLCGAVRADVHDARFPGTDGVNSTLGPPICLWLERFAHAGLVVCDPYDPARGPRLGYGMRVLDDGLEIGAFLGNARLRTHGSTGSLTVRCALRGRSSRRRPEFPSTSWSRTRWSTEPAAS